VIGSGVEHMGHIPMGVGFNWMDQVGSPWPQELLERYNLFGDRAEMDPQGRLLMPEELRNAGLANVEVKVSGEGSFLRVTSLQVLRESVSASPLSPQEEDSLAGYGV